MNEVQHALLSVFALFCGLSLAYVYCENKKWLYAVLSTAIFALFYWYSSPHEQEWSTGFLAFFAFLSGAFLVFSSRKSHVIIVSHRQTVFVSVCFMSYFLYLFPPG